MSGNGPLSQLTARPGVPEAERSVDAGGGDGLAVWRDHDRGNGAIMSVCHDPVLAAGQINHAHAAVAMPHGHALAIRGEGERVDRPGEVRKPPQLSPGGGIPDTENPRYIFPGGNRL